MNILLNIPIFKQAYDEQCEAIRTVWKGAEKVFAEKPINESPAFKVALGPLPDTVFSVENNLFSSFFITALILLEVPRPRRRLYCAINQLFRTWVTSADNLLDEEDKVTLPLAMSGSSRVMRQVIAIMLADRILKDLLDAAIMEKSFLPEEASRLARATLTILFPRAAEEGMEEGGLKEWPLPKTVLRELHPLKTGSLFQVAFLGPELFEPHINRNRLAGLKKAMLDFGLGCQILDDIRDIARDYQQRKVNYLISLLFHAPDADANFKRLESLYEKSPALDSRWYNRFPEMTYYAAQRAIDYLQESFKNLAAHGLAGMDAVASATIEILMQRLDLRDLADPSRRKMP